MLHTSYQFEDGFQAPETTATESDAFKFFRRFSHHVELLAKDSPSIAELDQGIMRLDLTGGLDEFN